jgi:hypothetical protein
MSTYGRDSYNPGKHVPKVVRCNAGRDEAVVYKNLGNGQRIKFLWTEQVTLVSGSYTLYDAGEFGAGKTVNKPDHYAPGGGFYGKTVQDLHVYVTPLEAPAGTVYVDNNWKADTLTIKSTVAEDIDVDCLIFST